MMWLIILMIVDRMQYLVRKWKKATRVGSEVVGGTVDQMNGKHCILFQYFDFLSLYTEKEGGKKER